MVRFASLVAFAGWIIGVCAQDQEPHWPVNVSVGGLFDEIPQCSKFCILAELEISGCSPLDPDCYCTWPLMDDAFDQCLAWYCTIDEFYEGSYQYHSTCNSPVIDHGPRLKKEIIAIAIIALVALTMRFITRLPIISVKWGADDWLASVLLWYAISELGYVLITFLTKITVLAFYLRIFPLGRIRKLIYLFIGICVCLLVSIFLAHLLQCLPIAAEWERYLGSLIDQPPPSTCGVDRDSLNWAFGITNVILDGIIMVLPIPELLGLELKLRRKLGLLLVFSVGFLITGVAIIRLIMLLNFNFTNNKTVTLVKVVKWCGIEAFLSIAVTCFPQVHLLGKRILGIWYKPDHSSQKSKPSFVSSNTMTSTAKDTSKYENLEMGLK